MGPAPVFLPPGLADQVVTGTTAASGRPYRLVRQLDPTGCGIACLAMLAGLTYDEAKAILGRIWRASNGIRRGVFDEAIAAQGFAVARRRGVVLNADMHLAEVIHHVQPKGTHHYVLVLGDGTVLDPDLPEPTTLARYKRTRSTSAIIPLEGPWGAGHWALTQDQRAAAPHPADGQAGICRPSGAAPTRAVVFTSVNDELRALLEEIEELALEYAEHVAYLEATGWPAGKPEAGEVMLRNAIARHEARCQEIDELPDMVDGY